MNEIKNKYKTKQESLIISFFKNNSKGHYSADEAYLAIASEGISRATVYRRIERLVSEGVLLKYNAGNGIGVYYQYCNHEHNGACLHFVCTKCNSLQHLDCTVFDDVQQHLDSNHHLKLDGSKTVFYGLCERCL